MTDQAKWIWFPADFEVELAAKVMTRRTERGMMIPPFWRLDHCYPKVKFRKKFILIEAEDLHIEAEGTISILLNSKYVYGITDTLSLPAGEYDLVLAVYNHQTLPALKITGKTILTGSDWLVTADDAHYYPVGTDDLVSGENTPNRVMLTQILVQMLSIEHQNGLTVFDFGKEMMGFVRFNYEDSEGNIIINYGESREEAADLSASETFDQFSLPGSGTFQSPVARAFRFLTITGAKIRSVDAIAEELTLPVSGSFQSSDPRMDLIYATSLYTLHLNTREFFLDGIKRDRWIWSGDAYQSYLMDYYSFFDLGVVRRTINGLFGKLPVSTHLNHIMDYSFYWVMAFADYFQFTGDTTFVRNSAEKVFALLDFCISRTDSEGLMTGLPGDWVFIDWANLDNSGQVSTEQMLYCKALETGALVAKMANDEFRKKRYSVLAYAVRTKIEKYWDEDQHAYLHSFKNGLPDHVVTRHANIFAILLGFADANRIEKIKTHVLLNEKIPKITTPYMRFYELSALLEVGEYDHVYDEILDYWGGMLNEGATSFWEMYDKNETGAAKYAMYGRPYGKSLCHAWGASPIYLLGKYFVGLKPGKDGYQTFTLSPHLSRLQWFDAELPLANGKIRVILTKDKIEVFSDQTEGELILEASGTKEERRIKITSGEWNRISISNESE